MRLCGNDKEGQMNRKYKFNPPAMKEDQTSIVPVDENQLAGSDEEEKEVRWLTVVRSKISESGGMPEEKLMWVGFVD
jgi:hypothetical protein